MKYIMFTSDSHGECPILFPDKIEHITVNMAMEKVNPGMNARSAGFIDILSSENKISVNCYGESKSLKIQSNHDDKKIIEICFGGIK